MVVFLNAADEVVRLAVGATGDVPSTLTRGDEVLAIPLLLPLPFEFPVFRNGEGLLPTTGGVAVRETGGVGRLIEGLSQEEKKSSFGSPAGVELPSFVILLITSVMITSLGYLLQVSRRLADGIQISYSVASRADLLFSSSLYLVAAFEVYFVVGSLLFNAAVPPFDWKNLVADSFPPTFMIRS